VIWTPPGVKHGLTEDVIADLARNNELLVIARNSTFATSTHGLAARPTGLGSSG
jgi:TolB-like protein